MSGRNGIMNVSAERLTAVCCLYLALQIGIMRFSCPRIQSLLVFFTVCLALANCHSGQPSASELAEAQVTRGKGLSRQYCGNCHAWVNPAALTKLTWTDHVLPAMARNLGLEVYDKNIYYAGRQAAVKLEDWLSIVAYYQSMAPDSLKAAPKPAPLINDWAIFSLCKPLIADTAQTATTTLVAIDTLNRHLYSSDALKSTLTSWNQQLQPVWQQPLPSPAVGASFFAGDGGKERGLFTCLGTMKAADIVQGTVEELALGKAEKSKPVRIGDQLPRPVQSVPGDFNKDGLTDWVVCGFGHDRGGLYWLKQRPGHQFSKVAIREVPGACHAVVDDFNHDGWPDIMALFAHADEGVYLFLNDQHGGFTTRSLLRFPPMYGSTSFQLLDFNHDGQLDILYTAGDNSDYSKILKPYHGVYLFLNTGNFRYKQAYFYPVNGSTKAVAADFDQDGDLDMASIAFFGDLAHTPAETFIYFEQTGALTFVPHAVPIHSYGRWLCMDVNDWDGDGDLDIALGNFSRAFINQTDFKANWNTHLPLVVLENKKR